MLANPVGRPATKALSSCFGDAWPSVVIPVSTEQLPAERQNRRSGQLYTAKLRNTPAVLNVLRKKVGEIGCVETALAATVNDRVEPTTKRSGF